MSRRGRSAARIVDAHARLRIHDPGHDSSDFRRRKVLAGGLAAPFGELADDGPDRLGGVRGFERQVEADELMVLLDELERLGARADLDGDAVQLIVENVTEPLSEDEREDEVLELRCLLRPANAACGVPNPGLE